MERPDPTPVLLAHHDELAGLTVAYAALMERLEKVERYVGRLPVAVGAIVSAGLTAIADELELPDGARFELERVVQDAAIRAAELLEA